MTEPDVGDLLTVDQAIEIIDAEPVAPRIETVTLSHALGRRLAQEIVADRDYPPFDKSLMDGYAIRCADTTATRDGHQTFRLIGEVAAGQVSVATVGAREAIAIMTGAPMPPGADGVVPVEHCLGRSDGSVTLADLDHAERFVAKRGCDVTGGTRLLEPGQQIGAAQIAVAASVGSTSLQVYARPTAGVLATGDEIVSTERVPGAAQIRNANSPMLVTLLQQLGCNPTDMGVVSDQSSAVRSAIERGLRDHDVLFVTGGMSMGAYDYVPQTLRELGIELRVTKLRIKPGKPLVFGVSPERKFVFGLPGNPVSAFVCALRLAARLLARIAGGPAEPMWRTGRLTADLAANGPREFYQPAMLDGDTVVPLHWKGSADLFTLARANALIVRWSDAPAAKRGEMVRLLEIPI